MNTTRQNPGFTPGPWEIQDKDEATFRTIRSNGKIIADALSEASFFHHPPIEEMEANARLIKAAPKMYEALINLENDDCSIPQPAWEKVVAAINSVLTEE